MAATRVFLVLFSIFSLSLNIAGQICSPDTTGAQASTFGGATTGVAGSLTNVVNVYIEKGPTGLGKLFAVTGTGAGTFSHAVFRWASAFSFTTNQVAEATYGTPGTSGTGLAFTDPAQITTDFAGNCYVADTGNNRLTVITSCYTAGATINGAIGDGEVTPTPTMGNTGTAIQSIESPTGVSVDSTVAFSATTNPLFYAMSNLAATADNRHMINKITAVSAFVDTSAALPIQVFGPASATGTCILGQPCDPRKIRFYSGPNILFVANAGNSALTAPVVRLNTAASATVFNPAAVGIIIGTTGASGSSSNINVPQGLSYDTASQTLYVADTSNHRIIYFTSPTTGAVATGQIYPIPASATTFAAGVAATSSTGVNAPADVDIAQISQGGTIATGPTVVIADTGNSRILRICAPSSSMSFSASVGGPSPSWSATFANANASPSWSASSVGISSSLSSSLPLGPSISTSQAAASFAISTSPTNSITVSFTSSYSYSITVSITTSLTTSITTSITTSVTNTNSNSQSITTSVTNSFSVGASTSNTGSYSISVSTSYSITVSRSVRLCGNGKIDGLEKCDDGFGVNGKRFSCCGRRCKPKDGGKICKNNKNVQCLGYGRCSDSGKCRGGKVLSNKPCSTSGVAGIKNGRCDISGNCVTTSV